MPIPRQERYSTRCPISHRPTFQSTEPQFYRCAHCGSVVTLHSETEEREREFFCCGERMRRLEPVPDAPDKLEFVVFGGFEQNAIRITVDSGTGPLDRDHRIAWIYLYTYQGGQMKFLPPGARPVAQFALADEDAYVYCDRPVCRMGREHCQFECKRGMTAYAYCTEHGLLRLPLTGLRHEDQ